jgi:hypothetical protein
MSQVIWLWGHRGYTSAGKGIGADIGRVGRWSSEPDRASQRPNDSEGWGAWSEFGTCKSLEKLVTVDLGHAITLKRHFARINVPSLVVASDGISSGVASSRRSPSMRGDS